MWQVGNRTPFAAQGYFARDRDGAEHWVVALRARFAIRPDGLLAIADEQEPVRFGPAYRDEQSLELAAESDFAPFRPSADVLLDGMACVAEGREATRCDVRLRVGALEKRARVTGARIARRSGGRRGTVGVDGPDTFASARLTWRASLGGVDPFADPGSAEALPHPENPVGCGWTARWRDLPEGAEIALPRIEAPDRPVTPGQPLPRPHGFGPLQRAWRPRIDRAGTYDDAWMAGRAPLLPEDFDDAFHQAAPPDQVYPGTLRGGEPVEIEGLHPEGPYAFRLPQIVLEARTRIGRDRSVERLRPISVAIDGTARTLDMTWNSSAPCNGRDHQVEGSTVILRQMAGVAS